MPGLGRRRGEPVPHLGLAWGRGPGQRIRLSPGAEPLLRIRLGGGGGPVGGPGLTEANQPVVSGWACTAGWSRVSGRGRVEVPGLAGMVSRSCVSGRGRSEAIRLSRGRDLGRGVRLESAIGAGRGRGGEPLQRVRLIHGGQLERGVGRGRGGPLAGGAGCRGTRLAGGLGSGGVLVLRCLGAVAGRAERTPLATTAIPAPLEVPKKPAKTGPTLRHVTYRQVLHQSVERCRRSRGRNDRIAPHDPWGDVAVISSCATVV